jgi:hypothetical protein
MRTVTYQSVLEGTLRMAGEDPTTALLSDKLRFSEFLASALGECHEYWRWPELVALEQRWFRETFDAYPTAIPAGVEVYYPPAEKYYRCIRATGGVPPATLTGGAWVTGKSYWWDPTSGMVGADWSTGTVYAAGAVVRNASDGLYYCCHTAHTSSGVLNLTKFALILPFRPYVAYAQFGQTEIEAVLEVYDRDPRSDVSALKVPFRMDADGVRFSADQSGPVFVEFRIRCPDYAWGAEWSALSFAAGAVVYHVATGEVYKAASAAAAGDVPGTAALWVKQKVPYIFRQAAKRRALAAWYEAEGQTDKALVHEQQCTALLDEQVWQYTKLQGQTGRIQTGK